MFNTKQKILGSLLLVAGAVMFFTGCKLLFGLSTTSSNIALIVASGITVSVLILLNTGFADDE